MSGKRTFLTTEQITELQVAYDRCWDGDTKIHFLAVRLYGTGMATADILEVAGCSRSSLMNWVRHYQTLGIAGLVDKRLGGKSPKLRPCRRHVKFGCQERIHHSYSRSVKQCWETGTRCPTQEAREGQWMKLNSS